MNTLEQCLTAYLEKGARVGWARATCNSRRINICRLIRWLREDGVTEPRQLTAEHLSRWMEALRKQRLPSGGALKPCTLLFYQVAVRSFCRELVRLGHCPSTLLSGILPMKSPSLLPTATPTHEEIRQLLAAMPTTTPMAWMMRTIGEVLYSTGMRPGELLGLNVENLYLEQGLIKVLGKRQKERMVPVGKAAIRLLESYLRGVRPLLLRDPENRALWLGLLGRRLSYSRLRANFKPTWPKQPKRRVTCYTFRRACATELVRSGANLWAVKELLGHESYEELKHYIQLTILDLQRTHARCHPRDRMLNTDL